MTAGGSGVFVSYRREDSDTANRLGDWLGSRFGPDRVFIDVARLVPGDDFPDRLTQAVQDARAVVAVITPTWRQGLSAADDWVRRELREALAANRPVVPVLFRGADPPGRTDLPPELATLADKNALVISNADYRDDVGRLVEALERLGVEAETITPLADIAPLSNRAEKRAAWDVPDDPDHARARLLTTLASNGFRVVSDDAGDVRLRAGNKLKARILGTLTGPESRLPTACLLRISDRGASVRIEVLFAEDWGAGLMVGVGGRYQSYFETLIAGLRQATARR